MGYEAAFSDEQAKRMKKILFDRFPLEEQVLAIYDMLEGRPEMVKAILTIRQQLAKEYFNASGILKVTGTLSVTHPNGAECTGEDCSTFGCPNRK